VSSSHTDLNLLFAIVQNTLYGDYVKYVASRSLEGKQIEHKDPTDLLLVEPGSRASFLKENGQAFLEMFVSRLVDNFQKYLVDVIREILRSKPAMLSTRQQTITLEELLKYERIEDLVHDVIERRVNSLSYEGFSELQRWCVERGIQIKVSASRQADVVELIATRNIIAHNRGLIDERYIRNVAWSKLKIGTCRVLYGEYLFEAFSLLGGIVYKTDTAARSKFGLPAVKIVPPTKRSEPAPAK
jgi:hypothetical protein